MEVYVRCFPGRAVRNHAKQSGRKQNRLREKWSTMQCFVFYILFYGVEDGTQGLVHAR
jgi:hypothetical protein